MRDTKSHPRLKLICEDMMESQDNVLGPPRSFFQKKSEGENRLKGPHAWLRKSDKDSFALPGLGQVSLLVRVTSLAPSQLFKF